MSAAGSNSRVTRAGTLLPALLALLALADLAGRFVPMRALAYRPWEALRAPPDRSAPFLPGRRVDLVAYGDLASMGGVRFPEDRRREVFTTDAAGFRNSVNLSGTGPVVAVLFGDSFVAGVGLSDDETLAARFREEAGGRVFNAGGLFVWSRERLDEVLAVAGVGPGGVVVYGLSEPEVLPVAPNPRRARRARSETPAGAPSWDFAGSRLGVVARRLGARVAGVARLSPGGEVVRRPLRNGDSMLFLSKRPSSAEPVRDKAVASWVKFREDLGARGLGLLVVLIPGKEVVYGDLLAERLPFRTRSATAAIAEALARRGVPALDLAPLLRSAARDGLAARRYVYWRDDTHWNPRGVRIAAPEVAKAFRAARRAGLEGGVPGRN